MTFWAQRSPGDPQNVDVHVTFGPVSINVTEHYGHLRSFHSELGKLLDEVKADAEGAKTGT